MAKLLLIRDTDGPSKLQELLEENGFHSLTTASSARSQWAVEEHQDDLETVFLDWGSDAVPSRDILTWLRSPEGLPEVEVVAFASEFDPTDIAEAVERGAFYFLGVPCDPLQLKALAKAAMRSCRLKRDFARKVADTEDTLQLLDVGTFHFRTTHQAKLLAVHLGAASANPQIGVGLHELMLNAVEHGNLAITYDEKSELIAENALQDEIQRRLTLPEYRDRRVTVNMQRLKRRLRLSIIDQGKGFDFERYQSMTPDRMFDRHGRGVIIASNFLKLTYRPPGNHVEVEIPLADDASDPAEGS